MKWKTLRKIIEQAGCGAAAHTQTTVERLKLFRRFFRWWPGEGTAELNFREAEFVAQLVGRLRQALQFVAPACVEQIELPGAAGKLC
jgi:hypothetical protein